MRVREKTPLFCLMEMISGGLLILLVMMSSADQEVKENLTSTVGGEVTIPKPVKSHGYLRKPGVIAAVRASVLGEVSKGFLGRLSWDQDTGLFTIRRLQTNDSGIYSVDIDETISSYKLSVYDAVLEPGVDVTSVSSEGCTLLCVVDKLSGGTLSWYKGEDLVNQSSTQLSLPLTVDRLGLPSSYRCVSANPAGNLTRSVDANTSCPVEQLTGDEDEEDSNRLGRIVILNICGVTFILFIFVIAFFVVKRKKTARHLQDSNQWEQGVTQQEEAVQDRSNMTTVYDQLQAHRIVHPTTAERAGKPTSCAPPALT